MSGLIAVRQSGPIGARVVETILLAQGAAFDLSGDIALNSAHRQGDGSDHADVAASTLKLSGIEDGAEVNNISDLDAIALTDGGETALHSHAGGGGDGGINYDSPIASNTTQTITPNNGDFFTSTSAFATLIGSAGEELKPTLSGNALTSFPLWGYGAGAAITLTIDTSSLGLGDQFAISLDDGESRVLRLDSAGDLVKVGEVSIPMGFKVRKSASQAGIASGVATITTFDIEDFDKGGVFASNKFTAKRPGRWFFNAIMSTQLEGAGSMTAAVGSLKKNSGASDYRLEQMNINAAAIMTVKGISGNSNFEMSVNDIMEVEALVFTSGPTWKINDDSAGSILTFFEGEEKPEW